MVFRLLRRRAPPGSRAGARPWSARRRTRRRPVIEQLEDLGGLEVAALGDHVHRADREVRQRVAARAVRQRRGMQDRVAGRELVDVGEIGVRLEQQVAMREHRALRHAGGAARIEEPRCVVGLHIDGRRLGLAAWQSSTAWTSRRHGRLQVRRDEAQPSRPSSPGCRRTPSGCSLAFIGTAVRPACQQANSISWYSGQFFIAMRDAIALRSRPMFLRRAVSRVEKPVSPAGGTCAPARLPTASAGRSGCQRALRSSR